MGRSCSLITKAIKDAGYDCGLFRLKLHLSTANGRPQGQNIGPKAMAIGVFAT